MIGKVVTGCVAILSYHTATQDRGSECRDFGFISRIVTALHDSDSFSFKKVMILTSFFCHRIFTILVTNVNIKQYQTNTSLKREKKITTSLKINKQSVMK